MAWLPNSFDPEEKEEEFRNSDERLARKSYGEDLEMEAVADAILAKGRRGTTRHSELRDYLSKSQLDLRRSREVYPASGHPEDHLFSGLYKRTYNPLSRGTHSSNSIPSFEEHEEGS